MYHMLWSFNLLGYHRVDRPLGWILLGALCCRVDLDADSLTECFERATGEVYFIFIKKRPSCLETTENSRL